MGLVNHAQEKNGMFTGDIETDSIRYTPTFSIRGRSVGRRKGALL